MRLSEISEEQIDELQPGQVPAWYDPRKFYGAGKVARQASKQDKQMSKNVFKLWYSYAFRVEKALQNDPNKAENRVKYFKAFLAKALKMPASSPVFSEVDNILGNGLNYTDKTVMQAIQRAVQQRALSSLGSISATSQQTQGTGNKTVKTANLGSWTWDGKQWINPAGQPAGGGLISILDKEAEKQGIVK